MECVGGDEPVWCVLAILVSSVWVPFWVCVSWPAAGCECSRLVVVKMSRFGVCLVGESQFLVAMVCAVCVVIWGGGVLCGSGRELQNVCSE